MKGVNKLKKTILLLGGARSGKSRLALEMARQTGQKVLFVATATAGDEEMRQRIENHRKERPAGWKTLESPAHIGRDIENSSGDAGVIVIDCITMLLNNVFSRYCESEIEQTDGTTLEKEAVTEIEELLACLKTVEATFIIISNEAGLGLVPAFRQGRLYRDILGRANQMLAQYAQEVYFLVAGIPMKVK
jgi:adenosylcobinamide kinase / adenosylcobinamide-phosphate guanylyltransferase